MPVPVATKVSGAVLATLAAEGIAGDHLVFVGILAATVAAVVGTVAWIDARIRSAIEVHTESDLQRHEILLERIQHIRELMEQAGGR